MFISLVGRNIPQKRTNLASYGSDHLSIELTRFSHDSPQKKILKKISQKKNSKKVFIGLVGRNIPQKRTNLASYGSDHLSIELTRFCFLGSSCVSETVPTRLVVLAECTT